MPDVRTIITINLREISFVSGNIRTSVFKDTYDDDNDDDDDDEIVK